MVRPGVDRRVVTCRRGQLFPSIATVSNGTASTLAPSFSIGRNALSGLGVPGTPAATIINGGLIFAAIVALPFHWLLFVGGK